MEFKSPPLLIMCFDKVGKGLSLISFVFGDVGDDAGVKVNGDFISIGDFFACLLTFQNGKADVDGVAIKNAGKGFSDDAGNSCGLDGDGGVFPGGTAAEVVAGRR